MVPTWQCTREGQSVETMGITFRTVGPITFSLTALTERLNTTLHAGFHAIRHLTCVQKK